MLPKYEAYMDLTLRYILTNTQIHSYHLPFLLPHSDQIYDKSLILALVCIYDHTKGSHLIR